MLHAPYCLCFRESGAIRENISFGGLLPVSGYSWHTNGLTNLTAARVTAAVTAAPQVLGKAVMVVV